MAPDSFLDLVRHKKKLHDNSELSNYELPLVTIDAVVFTIQDNSLQVLLIQRKQEPNIHKWALPGSFIHVGETLKDAGKRRLKEATGAKDIYIRQIGAFGKPGRDPRGRVITVAFYALVRSEQLSIQTDDKTEDIQWFSISELPKLAFDHERIKDVALHQLKDQLENTSIAFQLLPPEFTLSELQRVYELILDKTLDKRNFRKKIIATGVLEDTGKTKMEGYHRPAQLYAFDKERINPEPN